MQLHQIKLHSTFIYVRWRRDKAFLWKIYNLSVHKTILKESDEVLKVEQRLVKFSYGLFKLD